MLEQVKTIVRRIPVSGEHLSGQHPVLARIYANRDIADKTQLDYSLKNLLSFNEMRSIELAVSLLAEALAESKRIIIVADFDADGATSCAMMIRALKLLGAKSVDYLVPNRFTYGYGLTPEIVELAATKKPDLLITVDNGISSVEGVAAAKQHGMQVIVTDHHLPGRELPAADAIVNPNQQGDNFTSKAMAGVGVAFYVMLALRTHLRECDWFTEQNINEPNLACLLDLVALGTVADVVALDYNNRILVSQGLARVRQNKCCVGITALLEVAGRDASQCVASDFGFAVGPRLNAAGRIEDMSVGIECLLTDDINVANKLAQQLHELNKTRREIESDMREQAFSALDKLSLSGEQAMGVCLCDAHWHQGGIGILAARVKERLHRPVIAFASGEQEGFIKGSARSIPGLHIRDVLDAVATQHPGLISKFGGHAMAAGLSLPVDNLTAFQQAFDAQVRHLLSDDLLQGTVNSDGELESADLSLKFAECLRQAGPWGQGFEEPVFDGCFELVSRRVVGENHLKMMLRLPGESGCIDAIAFNVTDAQWPKDVRSVHLAYQLDVNEFRGLRSAQLLVQHVELEA